MTELGIKCPTSIAAGVDDLPCFISMILFKCNVSYTCDYMEADLLQVTEVIYVHSKLLIVDDKITIMGSG